MDAAEIEALAAGQKDVMGPTMMFATVESGLGEAGNPERVGATLTKEDTNGVASLFQQASDVASFLAETLGPCT